MDEIAKKLANLIEELVACDEPYMDKLAAVMTNCDKNSFEEFASWFNSEDEEEDDEC